MIFQIYSVMDSKAGAFAPPFFLANDTVALRSMAAARNDPNSLMSQFRSDFQLFHIGSFDDELGVVTPSPARLLVEAFNG